VESIRSHHDQVVEWIDRNDIDLICMQETKAGSRKFPRQAFIERGFELHIHGGDDGRGGVAVASRRPLTDIELGIPGAVAPLNEPRAIAVTVDGIRVHTAYAPNGRKVGTHPHQVKLAWFTLYNAWLEAERSQYPDLLVAADLNIAPLDIDIWEPSRYRRRNLTSPPERAAFNNLLNDGELVDVVRAHFGEQRAFTWWNRRSDFYETDRGWRLDHVLATPNLAARIADLSIDRAERGRERSTDHAPLLFTVDGL
jgi:exodeoxyribonuclease-3